MAINLHLCECIVLSCGVAAVGVLAEAELCLVNPLTLDLSTSFFL